ncbi:hypothetical protein PSm6_40670 [Pseudomonas solani]|uniref:Uncharacterized protein n=1 Tax=Pseudomonas solani TaxID=2731552 RepID=A0ABM7LDP4_9PSED|nr:hypothetical protein PSm6_40670 [Pseudomonas solani]
MELVPAHRNSARAGTMCRLTPGGSGFIRDAHCPVARPFALKEKALSALAVVVLMQALKHGPFRAPKGSCHLHRMGFASLYTILRKPVRTTGDALDEERWGSRQRPSRRPNAVVAPGRRAAWMPREARQAMDGPSRRPPDDACGERTSVRPEGRA